MKKQFDEQGFVFLSSLISHDDCTDLVARMRELTHRLCPSDASHTFEAGSLRQSSDEFFLNSANKISFFFDKNVSNAKGASSSSFNKLNKVGHALHDLCPVYKKFSYQEKFFLIMRELGHKKSHLLQSMFIFKQPLFGDGVPMHQDATFIYTEPSSVIGLWFALDDANTDNSCLYVMPGGHKGPLQCRFKRCDEGMKFTDQNRVRWPIDEFIPLCAKRGDAIILHGLLPHFSHLNRSQHTRFAYTLHFIDRACHYPRSNWLTLS